MTTVRFDAPAQPEAQGWTPATATAAGGGPDLPPGNPYLLAHHPARWAVVGDEVLPELIQISGQPGVSHTGREVRGGGGDMSGAILAAGRRGLVVIEGEREQAVSSALGSPLYRRIEVRGGAAYLDHGSVHVPGTRTVGQDPERYVAMLRAIRDVLPPPMPHVLEAVLERVERDHAAASIAADRDPLAARRRDELADHIDVLRAALDPEPAPAPKTRKPRRKAAAPPPVGDDGQE